MSALLLNAFKVLGSGPSRREIALVAKALRESGDVEVGPLLDYANNRDLWERCIALADEAGAYGFVALDLALAFHNPEAFAKLVRGEDDHLAPRPVDVDARTPLLTRPPRELDE